MSLPAEQLPVPAGGGGDEGSTVEESHRALTGWLSDQEGCQTVLGRTPSPTDSLDMIREKLRARRSAVATRDVFRPSDPIVESDPVALGSLRERPDLKASFAGMGWRPAMVDLRSVLSVQKSIRVSGLDDRMAGLGQGTADLVEFCLLTKRPAEPGRGFIDVDGRGMTIASPNPNLRVAGIQMADIQAQTDPNSPALPMRGLVVLVTLMASYLQVAKYNDRFFLRDGYHRAAGLIRAGVTVVPCVFIEARSYEEVTPSPHLFSYETMFSDRPPRLVDFWDAEVADDVSRPAVRKVIRVRGDEFVVEG